MVKKLRNKSNNEHQVLTVKRTHTQRALVWYAWQPVALLSLLMKESTVLAPNRLPSLLHPTIPAVSLVGIRQRRMCVRVFLSEH